MLLGARVPLVDEGERGSVPLLTTSGAAVVRGLSGKKPCKSESSDRPSLALLDTKANSPGRFLLRRRH